MMWNDIHEEIHGQENSWSPNLRPRAGNEANGTRQELSLGKSGLQLRVQHMRLEWVGGSTCICGKVG